MNALLGKGRHSSFPRGLLKAMAVALVFVPPIWLTLASARGVYLGVTYWGMDRYAPAWVPTGVALAIELPVLLIGLVMLRKLAPSLRRGLPVPLLVVLCSAFTGLVLLLIGVGIPSSLMATLEEARIARDIDLGALAGRSALSDVLTGMFAVVYLLPLREVRMPVSDQRRPLTAVSVFNAPPPVA